MRQCGPSSRWNPDLIEDFATELRHFLAKILTRGFGRQETNITSDFDTEIETTAFRHDIQHVASSIDQFWPTSFASHSLYERSHACFELNARAAHEADDVNMQGSEQQDGSSDYAFPEAQNRSLAGSSIAQKRKANRDCKKEDSEHGEAKSPRAIA